MSPHSVLFPITAVAPLPHTPGPAQTETTSQPHRGMSLREAGRKWVVYICACVRLSVLYSYILYIICMCECVGHLRVLHSCIHAWLGVYGYI